MTWLLALFVGNHTHPRLRTLSSMVRGWLSVEGSK